MPSTGPNNPSSAFNDDNGATDWTNASNALSLDAAYAGVSLAASGTSEKLRCIGFGFGVPAGATVDGILVEVAKAIAGPGGEIQDNSVRLLESGSYAGDDKAIGDVWLETPIGGYTSYGGASDDWGVTWTAGAAGTINASGFGVGISCRESGGTFGQEAYIDHIRITVYYTSATGGSDAQQRVRRNRRSAILRM